MPQCETVLITIRWKDTPANMTVAEVHRMTTMGELALFIAQQPWAMVAGKKRFAFPKPQDLIIDLHKAPWNEQWISNNTKGISVGKRLTQQFTPQHTLAQVVAAMDRYWCNVFTKDSKAKDNRNQGWLSVGVKPNDNQEWSRCMQQYDNTWRRAYCNDEHPHPRIGSVKLVQIMPDKSLSEQSTVNTTNEPTPHLHVDAVLNPYSNHEDMYYGIGQDVELQGERLAEFTQLSKEDREAMNCFFWNLDRDVNVLGTGYVKEEYQQTVERKAALKELRSRTPPSLHSTSRRSLEKYEMSYHKKDINRFPSIKIPVYVQLLTYPESSTTVECLMVPQGMRVGTVLMVAWRLASGRAADCLVQHPEKWDVRLTDLSKAGIYHAYRKGSLDDPLSTGAFNLTPETMKSTVYKMPAGQLHLKYPFPMLVCIQNPRRAVIPRNEEFIKWVETHNAPYEIPKAIPGLSVGEASKVRFQYLMESYTKYAEFKTQMSVRHIQRAEKVLDKTVDEVVNTGRALGVMRTKACTA
jgi:hypothetical protein